MLFVVTICINVADTDTATPRSWQRTPTLGLAVPLTVGRQAAESGVRA